MSTSQIDQALRRATGTIRELRGRISHLERTAAGSDEAIAVVGVACRFPEGADSPAGYWRDLAAGRNLVRPLTPDRWSGIDFSALDDPDFARIVQHAGQVGDVDLFDADFFGIDAAEADLMDPQQRLVLMVALEVVENAGWPQGTLRGSATGVFLGVGHQDYLMAALASRCGMTGRLATGNARSILANRVSYELDLTGPSLTIDTACSSSLVAVHLACQALRVGDCDRALAGGINLILSPLSTTLTGRALPLAPDGRCKALASDADGMIRGEGCGVVALRRLSDALADGDRIEAVILADAVNQDGRTNGLTAPSPVAQQALLQSVLDNSRLSAADVTYIEMHGTGTPLGDPIEFEAIRSVYGACGSEAPTCWLGSVKANVGHLESAAGIASMIKVICALRHGRVPGQINITRPNPHLTMEGTRFAIPRRTETWVPPETRRAAVSSFGFGGTNAHLILAHPRAVPSAVRFLPAQEMPDSEDSQALLVPLSARSVPALIEHVVRTAEALDGRSGPELRRAAVALARRRTHHARRIAVAVDRPGALPEAIRGALVRIRDGSEGPPATTQRVAFVYTGQTGQWARMGIALAEADPVVREELTAWDKAIAKAGGSPLLETLSGPDSEQALADTRFAQLAIVGLQAALTHRLRSWGIVPVAVIGHSVGEIAAAVAAGVLSRPEAVKILLARGEALHRHAAGGAMLAVRAPAAAVRVRLTEIAEPGIGIAAINGPEATVVSGSEAAVITFLSRLGQWSATRLPTGYAFHSPLLADAAGTMGRALQGLRPGPGSTPLYSTVTGSRIPGEALDGDYWVRNVVETVQFAGAAEAALADGVTGFVEIGPHPALVPHVRAIMARAGISGPAIATLRRGRDTPQALLAAVGALWEAGYKVDWTALYPGPAAMVELPTYPWQRKRHRLAVTPPGGDTAPDDGRGEAVQLTEAAILRLLTAHLAEVMRLHASELDPDRPARDYDIDSVALVEVKNRIESDLGVAVPITALSDGASLRDIACRLTAATRPGPTPEEARAALEHFDQLPDDEVERLLAVFDTHYER